MGDDANASCANPLAAAFLQNILRPIIDVGNASPIEQFFAVDLNRRIAGEENGILSFPKVRGRNEIRV